MNAVSQHCKGISSGKPSVFVGNFTVNKAGCAARQDILGSLEQSGMCPLYPLSKSGYLRRHFPQENKGNLGGTPPTIRQSLSGIFSISIISVVNLLIHGLYR